jgi:hypothetical protein
MALPPAVQRTDAHTRKTAYRGYARADGLWDIDCEMTDTKPFPFPGERGELRPGDPVHHMLARVTVDDSLTIVEIHVSMAATPFGECPAAEAAIQKLTGARLGPGWRQTIEKTIGGISSCTHLRELLFNAATAAYQTIPAFKARQMEQNGEPEQMLTTPPPHLGKCLAWDFDGPVVARRYPQFAGFPPLKKV